MVKSINMSTKMVDIKKLLKMASVTQTEIADMLRVSVTAVHYVVKGKKHTARIRKAIALSLGRTVNDLWPENNNASTPASVKKNTNGDVGRTSDPSRG